MAPRPMLAEMKNAMTSASKVGSAVDAVVAVVGGRAASQLVVGNEVLVRPGTPGVAATGLLAAAGGPLAAVGS